MQTLIHYTTPPGWQDKPQLPTLRSVHARPGPRLRESFPARQQPPTRVGVRPAPEPDDLAVALGLPWQIYAGVLVFGVLVALGCVWTLAHGAHTAAAPLLGSLVAAALSLSGLVDYARAAVDAERAR